MKLTFINSKREEREIGKYATISEAEMAIRRFLDEHKYKSYYFKISCLETKWVYDVGSWSEFFILYKDNTVELNKYDVYQEARSD